MDQFIGSVDYFGADNDNYKIRNYIIAALHCTITIRSSNDDKILQRQSRLSCMQPLITTSDGTKAVRARPRVTKTKTFKTVTLLTSKTNEQNSEDTPLYN